MIEYKVDVIKLLNEIGFNTTTARVTGIFGQATMKKFKDKDTSITLDNLNRLCCLLNMQPDDIIRYKETEEDKKNIITKLSEKRYWHSLKLVIYYY